MSQPETPTRMNCTQSSGGLGRDANVAAERQRQAAAVGRPVDGGDQGLLDAAQVRDQSGDVLLGQHPGPRPLGALGQGARMALIPQVQAGAETSARPREHHHPAAVVGLQLVQGLVQLAHQPPAQRVENARAVQAQYRDRLSVPLDLDVGHAGASLCQCPGPGQRPPRASAGRQPDSKRSSTRPL